MQIGNRIERTVSLATWSFAVWLLLTWTATLEQLVFGAVLSLAIGIAMASLGVVVRPWALLRPRRLVAITMLFVTSAGRIVRANVALALRIWTPRRPLRSGMVIVATEMRSDCELAAVGLITSLVVDNQLVDLDRSEHELQYHAVDVPEGTAAERAEHVNAPTERAVRAVMGR